MSSVFTRPTALPLYGVDAIWAERVLIIAPHPDDECLGCGGAAHLLHSHGCNVQVLVISNGTMSHPNSRKFPAPVLQTLREAETKAAMAVLGIDASAICFLGLQDGAVPTQGAEFERALQRCCAYLKSASPQLVFLPQRGDPHPDHRASWQLIRAGLEMNHQSVRQLEYPIWNWDRAQRNLISGQFTAWRLDISDSVEQKLEAIQAYRSQVSDLIDDDPEGFRLSTTMLDYFQQPWEVYFEEVAG
jgi:LmbE family N-acetylglucosaminyl deacetylase